MELKKQLKMEESTESLEQLLESSRFWIQRVFVPIMVCIGVSGNIVAVMVLTRRRMRCSTNIYLTALAIADIVYLLFVFTLSVSHYDNIHDGRYELYWRFYGLAHWICDAASSTSVWLTVAFTLERYIAVCHPIRGKVICTENRAKSIIIIVAMFCILTTVSTTFEYQLSLNETCINRTCTKEEMYEIQQQQQQQPQQQPKMDNDLKNNNSERDILTNSDEYDNNNNTTIIMENWTNELCCTRKFTVGTEPTELANSNTYQKIIQWYSALCFVLIPIVFIATFNSFLIRAVYRSQKKRQMMTNSHETVSLSNENRITIMLIGVVILFLICQTPTASLLIFNNFHTSKDSRTQIIKYILGNFFNFLVTINAACNFLLYCVLSKKFRSTFKSFFIDRKHRQDTLLLTATSTGRYSQRYQTTPATATTGTTTNKNGFKRNISEYRTPRNLETQSLAAMPRSRSLMARPPGKAKSTDLNF